MHDPLPVERLRRALRAWVQIDADHVGIEPVPPGATADVFAVTDAASGHRWIAKYNYDYRDYFEAGLRTSLVLDEIGLDGLAVGAPLLTSNGDLTVMVEWPEGHLHPLALLRFIDGLPLTADDPRAVEIMGEVCGRVHARLLTADCSTLGVTPNGTVAPAIHDTWDLGDHSWLNSLYAALVERAVDVDDHLRHTVGVWDGPDIRVDGDRVGLIDFGHTGWHPLIYVVANRSLIAAYGDRQRLQHFLAAVERHVPLTGAEKDALDLHRLINATIYARWAAAHPAPDTTRWLDRLVGYLRTDAPRVGLSI